MRLLSCLRPLAARLSSPRPRAIAPRRSFRPRLEGLEDRTTPSAGGLLDPTFGSGGIAVNNFSSKETVADIALQSDGKILTAGYTSNSGTGFDFAVARYNANGTLDA